MPHDDLPNDDVPSGDPTDALDDATLPSDAALVAAGARLRSEAPAFDAFRVQEASLRRSQRRSRLLAAAASVVAVGLLGALVVTNRDDGERGGHRQSAGRASYDTPADTSEVDKLLAKLGDAPIDPADVQLVSTVQQFDGCDALIEKLRTVGAQHVGSQGFGASSFMQLAATGGDARMASVTGAAATSGAGDGAAVGGVEGTTLGTNVQVEGVDEVDRVKAVGRHIYDLDGAGHLRVIDAAAMAVVGTADVTSEGGSDTGLLVTGDGRAIVFGSRYEVSAAIDDDPSATVSSTSWLTVSIVDVTDPTAPKIVDAVSIEGTLVSARLVGDEVRMVTTSNLADLGFVMPTTPNSVATALDINRRAVASSTASDWIPDWVRAGDSVQPLMPCERVVVPDTFGGVAMTSMVTFDATGERFEPQATGLMAPGDTLYAGLDSVVIASTVWVSPAERDRVGFTGWKTAVHRFGFEGDDAPGYVGSGIVDGSVVGQFSFGELGSDLGVVTTAGTPWGRQPDQSVDLTVLVADSNGALTASTAVRDLSGGTGAVASVRFLGDRVLVATGPFGRTVRVIDTSDPAAPRAAGSLTLGGDAGYFHLLDDHRVLSVGGRLDGGADGRQYRHFARAELLDLTNPDAPQSLAQWETADATQQVSGDHHAFTWWPERQLALFGIANTEFGSGAANRVAVLSTAATLTESKQVVVSLAPESAPACPKVTGTPPMMGPDGVVLHCDDAARTELSWPRYSCALVSGEALQYYGIENADDGAYFACTKLSPPMASRVLVVDDVVYFYTDQTLERIDPASFTSTGVMSLPNGGYLIGY